MALPSPEHVARGMLLSRKGLSPQLANRNTAILSTAGLQMKHEPVHA